jgi:hypothetical protein
MEGQILKLDFDYETLIDTIGEEVFNRLKDGDSLDGLYEHELVESARIIEICGPGGGNPFIEFKFRSTEDAWDWWMETVGVHIGGSEEQLRDEFEVCFP